MPVVGAAYAADQLFNGGGVTKGVGKALGGVGDIGHNNFQAQDYAHSGEEDPNAFDYGGWSGGAAEAADRYANTSNAYTAGAQGAFGGAGTVLGEANADRDAAYGARGSEADALGLMADRAHGQDLIANKIAAQQANTLQAQQQSAAAGARGPAALALAQQGAAANTSAGQAQIASGAEIAGAQEQLANEQAYLGGAGTIRGQDINQMGATTGLGSAYTQAGTAQGQLGLGYTGAEQNVQNAQLNAQTQKQNIQAQSQSGTNATNAGVSTANAQNQWELPKMVLGAGSSIGSTVASAASDPLAKDLMGALGLGSKEPGASSGPNTDPSGDYAITKGGGLDAAQTMRNINGHVADAMNHPGSSGGFASDPAAKEQILALYEPEGMQLHMDPQGHAGLERERPDATSGASVSGAAPRYGHEAPAAHAHSAVAQAPRRQMTPEEMNAEADRMLARINGQREGLMSRGPAVQPALDRGQPPAWLQAYMAPEQASDPKAKVDVKPEGILGQAAHAIQGLVHRDSGSAVAAHAPRTAESRGATELSVDRGGDRTVVKPGVITTVHGGAPIPTAGAAVTTAPKEDLSLTEKQHLPHTSDPNAKAQMYALGHSHGTMGMPPQSPVQGGVPTYQGNAGVTQLPAMNVAARPPIPPQPAPMNAMAPRPPMGPQARPTPNVSDPRGKVLGGVHDDEVADTLDATPAVSYKYKSEYFEPNAQRPGERQAGFLTSDLKKTPLGAAVVEKRPDGFEGYNEHRMIGLEFAGLRNVHERLRDLEAIIAEKHRGAKAKGGSDDGR